MNYIRLFPILFLALTAVGYAADKTSDSQPSQYSQERQFNVAQKMQIDGLYDNALKQWNDFLKKYPKSTMALEAKYNRGLCFYELQKYEEAKRDLDEVLKSGDKASKKAEALLFCGLSSERLTEKNPAMAKDAQVCFETLIKEFPDSDYVLYAKFNLAKLFEKMNNLVEAKKLFDEIWQKSPDYEFAPEAYLKSGYILFKQKSYEPCIKLATEFSQKWNNRHPDVYNAAVLAGDALYITGNYAEAEKQYAFACNPKAEGIDKFEQMDYALYNRGVCLVLLREYAKAAEQFSEMLTRFPKSNYVPEATLACGDACWKNSDVKKAKEYLLKASDNDKTSAKANLLLAEIFYKENDNQQALKRIDLTPELQFKCLPTEPEARQTAVRQACVLRASIFFKSNDTQRLQTCVKLCNNISAQWSDNPSAPWAAFLAAQAEYKLEQFEKAVDHCRKVQTQWKGSIYHLDSQILEALCLIQLQQYKEAGNLYYSLYKNNPNDNRRFEWLVSTCKMLDLFEQYETIYKILPKEIPNIKSNVLRPEALYLSGKAACELNRLDYAMNALRFCREKYPDYSGMDKVLFVQGLVYEKQDNNGKALETFQKILDDYPESTVRQGAASRMTQLYRVMGNFKAALDQADSIIAQDVNSTYRPGAIIDSMFILVQNDMWDQALKRGDLFIKDYPQNENVVEAYRLRALCKYNLKMYGEAVDDCRKGLETAQKQELLDKWELLLRQLEVSSLAQQDDKIDETRKAFDAFMDAKKRLDKSVANEDSVIYLYANALYKAGKKDDANKQYKYLFDNYKTSPYRFESAFSLGQAAIALKRIDKAKELFTFAINGSDAAAAIKSAHKMGWIYYGEKSYEEAFKQFVRAAEIYDASSKEVSLPGVDDVVLDSRVMAAECLYWQKKFAEALTRFKDLSELPIQYRAMKALRTAQCSLETGDFELAASQIDSVLDENNAIVPELEQTSKKWEPALQHLRAKIWFKTNQKDKAEKLFEQIVKQNEDVDPANVPETSFLAIAESWFYLGELTFQKEAYRDAIPKYYNVIYGYKFPDLQADACYEAARCFEAIKQVNQARNMYQMIVTKFPNSPKAPIAANKLKQLKQTNP